MQCQQCGHIVEIDDMLCYNCYLNEESARLDCPDISEYQEEEDLPF